jgi:hypothetical protein
MFINRNYVFDTSASKLKYDNLALAFVVSDDWHDGYEAVSNTPDICTVDYFVDNYSDKSWIPENLKKFRGHKMTIVFSHYDCNDDFLERFNVKEVK